MSPSGKPTGLRDRVIWIGIVIISLQRVSCGVFVFFAVYGLEVVGKDD